MAKTTKKCDIEAATAHAENVLRGYNISKAQLKLLQPKARRMLASALQGELNAIEGSPASREAITNEVLKEVRDAIETSLTFGKTISVRSLGNNLQPTGCEARTAMAVISGIITSLRGRSPEE